MKITKVNEKYLLEDVPYEEHRRGKNYTAVIVGLDTKFGFSRKFLEKTKLSTGHAYLFDEKPSTGQIVQVMAIYHSGGGHPTNRSGSGYFRIEKDGSLTLMTIEEVRASFESTREIVEL